MLSMFRATHRSSPGAEEL